MDVEEHGSGSSGGHTDQFEMLDHATVVPDSEWTKIESEKIEESPIKENREELVSNNDLRKIPELFKSELYSLLNNFEPKYILSEDINIISQLTDLLPKILLSLPSNKKEDLIPLISLSARLHPDPDQAAKLIALLLALRKRPQDSERKAIINGLCDLAGNQNLIESQLLPQIWDLAGVKTVEKRLLAAEICSSLAPITSNHIRKSQLLPLLQQLMVEASEEEIKISVVQNLSIVIIFINDSDKYFQCEELCFLALKDNSLNVQACTIQLLLPVLAQWAFQINKLESHLLTRLISRLRGLSKDLRCIQLINAILTTLPYLLIYVGNCEIVFKKIDSSTLRTELIPIFQSLSNPEYFYEGQPKSMEIINGLNSCLNEEWYPMWSELEWVIDFLLPELYQILCSLDILNEEIVISFVKLFHFICKGFGKNFTTQKIKPLFKVGLKNLEDSVSKLSGSQDMMEAQASLMVIPVLLVSILTTGDPSDTRELSETLQHLLVSLPACNLPTTPLKVSLSHLCRAAALQEVVLTALSVASKHSRPVVRLSAAQLSLPCLTSLQESLVVKYVLPMLSMLANDNDGEVREATVALFAELIATSKCNEAQMQSRAALQAFLKDSPANVSHTMSLALTRALARVIPSCDPAFREDVVLPHLGHLVTHCQHSGASQTRRMDLGVALVSAVSAATQAPLSKQAMASYLVPALRSLECVTGACLSAHHDAVTSWLREAESRCNINTTPSTPTTPTDRSVVPGSQLMQSAMSSASAVGRRSVEDVKQKVSSLLRKK